MSPPASSSLIGGPVAAAKIKPADLQRDTLAGPDADFEIRIVVALADRKAELKTAPAGEREEAVAARGEHLAGAVAGGLDAECRGKRQALMQPRFERHRMSPGGELDVRAKGKMPG